MCGATVKKLNLHVAALDAESLTPSGPYPAIGHPRFARLDQLHSSFLNKPGCINILDVIDINAIIR